MSGIEFQVTRPQAEFHALTCKYPLFIGGYGSGKTHALINQAVMDALVHPDAIIAVFAPSFANVRDVLIPRFLETLTVLGLLPKLIKSERKIVSNHPQCGAFSFYSMDDPESITGIEIYTAHVDELDTMPMYKATRAWSMITARARQRLPDCVKDQFNRVSAYSTPKSFNFTYNRWGVNLDSERYKFVRASSSSNPLQSEDYLEGLCETYSKAMQNAYLEGHWVNLTSGQVYICYDKEKCNSTEVVEGDEDLSIGIDFNVTKMHCTIYVKRKNPNLSSEKKEVWHAVDEICNAKNTSHVIDILEERYPDNNKIMYPDATGNQRSSATSKNVPESNIAMLTQAGYVCIRNKSNPLIIDRVEAMNNALEKGWVRINYEKCPTVSRCLEQQAYDPNGVPDKSRDQDHATDACSYPIAYVFKIRRPASNVPVQWGLMGDSPMSQDQT